MFCQAAMCYDWRDSKQRVTMTAACRVPTPAEKLYGDIQSKIEWAMMEKVFAALNEAAEQARTEVQGANLDMPAPSADYFAAVIHQRIFCILCKADPNTFEGGRADIALAIIRNSQNIARLWGADIEP
jgi:hypothetical protein